MTYKELSINLRYTEECVEELYKRLADMTAHRDAWKERFRQWETIEAEENHWPPKSELSGHLHWENIESAASDLADWRCRCMNRCLELQAHRDAWKEWGTNEVGERCCAVPPTDLLDWESE